MTRGEAIEELKELLQWYLEDEFQSETFCKREAVEIAVKALSENKEDTVSRGTLEQIMWERDIAIQQLKDLGYSLGEKPKENKCGDLISRQAVENITWEEPSYTDPLNVLTEVREKVRALPSVENKGEWIPVSERLPEEREWYLAVFKEKDTDFQLIPRVADYIGHGENKWRWIDDEGLPQEYFDLLECVAWQPLPEPYKKGGE